MRDALPVFDSECDVMHEREFPDHAATLAWAHEEDELDDEVQRVELLNTSGLGRQHSPSGRSHALPRATNDAAGGAPHSSPNPRGGWADSG